jgi:hypothetical protein
MGIMQIMNQSGDITVEWDPKDEESTKKAEAEFKKLSDDGYEFFEVVDTKGKRVKKFSAKAGKLIAAPGVQNAKDRKNKERQGAMGGGPNAAYL